MSHPDSKAVEIPAEVVYRPEDDKGQAEHHSAEEEIREIADTWLRTDGDDSELSVGGNDVEVGSGLSDTGVDILLGMVWYMVVA